MKKFILMTLIVVAFIGCSKDEPEPEPTLTGTLWSSYSYKSIVGNEDVYRMLRFINENKMEYYSAAQKSRVIGKKDTLIYTYSHPALIVQFETNTANGEVFENYLILGQNTYNKE